VQSGQTGTYVYIIDASQKAVVRAVTPGRAVGEFTVIDSGLEVGERVVVDGQSRLVPGSKVDIQPNAPPAAASKTTSKTASKTGS
jgi:multidrug efflux system membrane fusion protein